SFVNEAAASRQNPTSVDDKGLFNFLSNTWHVEFRSIDGCSCHEQNPISVTPLAQRTHLEKNGYPMGAPFLGLGAVNSKIGTRLLENDFYERDCSAGQCG